MRTDPLIFLTHPDARPLWLIPPLLLMALTLVLGRYFCGWICPLGSLIEILDLLLKPLRNLNPWKLRLSSGRIGKFLRYSPALFILGVVLVSTIFSWQAVWPAEELPARAPPLLQFFHPNIWIIRIAALTSTGFVSAGSIFLILLILFSLFSRRFWCKFLCPLGALYGLAAQFSLVGLSIDSCSNCARCNTCPMDAAGYRDREVLRRQCILCFDYEHHCPVEGFRFNSILKNSPALNQSRREFLKASLTLAGGLVVGAGISAFGRSFKTQSLRPPGVLNEQQFVQRCLRCLQCVRSCPNEIIKPGGLEAGFDGFMTPHLEFDRLGCDYYCQVCQRVCPNEAIPLQTLAQKQKSRIGRAFIDQEKCVVYAEQIDCIVCEEMCPIPHKAVLLIEKEGLKYPMVVSRCIGCGICEAFCPVDPRAITVRKI